MSPMPLVSLGMCTKLIWSRFLVPPEPVYDQDGVRLYCGDAREVMRSLPAESVDAIVTDPPYNVGKDFGSGKEADRRPDYVEWLNLVWIECGRIAKEGGFLIYTNRIKYLPIGMNPPLPWRLFHIAVWHKPLALAGCWYGIAPHWEPIFILVKGKPWRAFRGPDVLADVLSHNVVIDGNGNHPTVKPTALYQQLIDFASLPGEIICDPFLGSGTTAVAARMLGRRCIGIDVSERYIAQAIKRLELGDKAMRRLGANRRDGLEQATLW